MARIAILLLLLTLSARAELTVDAFVPTNQRNDAPGRSDTLRLEINSVEVKSFGDLLEKLKPTLPPMDPKRPPVIPIYLSPDRTPEEAAAVSAEATAQFRKAFPGITPKVEVRYLEDSVALIRKEAAANAERIEAQKGTLPPEVLAAMREANEKALKEALEHQAQQVKKIREMRKHKGWLARSLEALFSPAGMRSYVIGVSHFKGWMTGLTRTAQVVDAGTA